MNPHPTSKENEIWDEPPPPREAIAKFVFQKCSARCKRHRWQCDLYVGHKRSHYTNRVNQGHWF